MALLRRIITKKLKMSEHSPAGRKHLKRKKKKKKSMRTKGIEAKLRKAGLSEQEIYKLRGSRNE